MTPLLELLTQRARDTPHEPWLFGRRNVDWGWISWAQALDAVARTAKELRDDTSQDRDENIRFEASRLPWAILQDAAVAAAGVRPEPLWTNREEDAAEESSENRDVVRLAEVRSRLGRWTPESLPAADAHPDVVREHRELLRQAQEIVPELPDEAASVGGRPLLLTDPALLKDPDSGALRLRRALAFSLVSGAAWAAEDESFFGAALWARPSVVVTSPRELRLLVEAGRKKKRWDRLRAAILDGEHAGETSEGSELSERICLLSWPSGG